MNISLILIGFGLNLANKIPNLKGDITDYIKSNYPNSMFVTSTDPQEIENSVQLLKQTNSIGYDGLSSYVIKKTISDISVALSIVYIFNFRAIPESIQSYPNGSYL